MSNACPDLAHALDLFQSKLSLFGLPWAYLHKQLGTFRVSPLLGNASDFGYLRSTPADLQSGVYRGPIRLNLVHSDTDLTDIYLPNGNYKKNGAFEWLSYWTDERREAPLDWLQQDDRATEDYATQFGARPLGRRPEPVGKKRDGTRARR